jgi:hypothetical protein
MSEKFDIYSKIFFRDVENFVRHLCVLVLRHQMRVSNYFVNSFYSASSRRSKKVLVFTKGLLSQGTYKGRIGEVYVPSQLERTPQLYM